MTDGATHLKAGITVTRPMIKIIQLVIIALTRAFGPDGFNVLVFDDLKFDRPLSQFGARLVYVRYLRDAASVSLDLNSCESALTFKQGNINGLYKSLALFCMIFGIPVFNTSTFARVLHRKTYFSATRRLADFPHGVLRTCEHPKDRVLKAFPERSSRRSESRTWLSSCSKMPASSSTLSCPQ